MDRCYGWYSKNLEHGLCCTLCVYCSLLISNISDIRVPCHYQSIRVPTLIRKYDADTLDGLLQDPLSIYLVQCISILIYRVSCQYFYIDIQIPQCLYRIARRYVFTDTLMRESPLNVEKSKSTSWKNQLRNCRNRCYPDERI